MPGSVGRAQSLQLVVRLIAAMLLLSGMRAPADFGASRLADDPMRLHDQITDRVDALGSRRAEVQSAFDVLRSQSGLQLFVVYVRSFDGVPSGKWAYDTARLSDLGRDDGLLAVATGDRAYAYSFDSEFRLNTDQLEQVARIAIEPPLAGNDWAGAAVGAAKGYGAALAGQPIPPPTIQPGDPDPGGDDNSMIGFVAVGLCVLVLLALLVSGVWLVVRMRKPRPGAPAQGGRAGPPDPLAAVSDAELSARANSLLVDADDAIKTSEQELAFAVAQYGQEATSTFTAAVQAAKEDVGRAFQLRQQLDDAVAEDRQTRRDMLAEIIRRCEAADRRLDAEADAFDRLRDLEGRLDEATAQVNAAAEANAARVPPAVNTLDDLRAGHADSALREVSDNIVQAQKRIRFATDALHRAEQAATAGDRSSAAVAVRGAQEAVNQADTLLDAVDKLKGDLAQVRAVLQGALSDVDADLAAGRAMVEAGGPASADLAGQVARAEQVAASVRAGLAAPRPDPVEALRRLREAAAGLDRALAGARDAAEQRQRARSALDQAIARARTGVSAAADFIATRRGAVGGQARTRLAEAQRHLDQAVAQRDTDPQAALAEAEQADALAEMARRSAQDDVNRWSMPGDEPFGGVGGAVLGGILLGGVLGGGHGGFGGWGGRMPGGFGGSISRGRIGGGGRF